MSTAIWRKQDDEWKPLKPSGFPSEEKLHDLVQEAPHLLPLAGDPILTVVGREVVLGSGRVDLLAVEADGRPVVIEIKLQRNAEARRAVVAQVLTYAAQLQGMTARELDDLLRPHVTQIGAMSIADAAGRTDQSGEFDAAMFNDDLDAYLKAGSFRLVLVLDEAPSELVQLVGYLERVATAIAIDVITVSAYEAGARRSWCRRVSTPRTTGPGSAQARPRPGRESAWHERLMVPKASSSRSTTPRQNASLHCAVCCLGPENLRPSNSRRCGLSTARTA